MIFSQLITHLVKFKYMFFADDTNFFILFYACTKFIPFKQGTIYLYNKYILLSNDNTYRNCSTISIVLNIYYVFTLSYVVIKITVN